MSSEAREESGTTSSAMPYEHFVLILLTVSALDPRLWEAEYGYLMLLLLSFFSFYFLFFHHCFLLTALRKKY